ncbi:protein kinase [Nostoc sp. FACHB-87]|uniref:protein kinase domain-containing protein n=1 Tax=Nostocales TaxID=1161 RepID=UPI0016872704|nr:MULTISPECIES: protein kinase [Nostocales]MBD2303480.1 protein kinase [Nostoc sp. FACHB-190]MBD2457331.1 protein kinase [Nostoc sp. FACHB-87]MBD2478400.1 protein kinase [Anabaena sp. FACHB-83]MBD2491222.1 protein kinase [Aulosira sp. FACHB-615]
MSYYCINPLCDKRENPDSTDTCLGCGKSLLINNRIRLLKPLRELSDNPFTYNEIFEIEDKGTEWITVPKVRVMKIVRWTSSKAIQLIEREALALSLIDCENIPQTNGSEDFFTYRPENSPFMLRCLIMDKIEGQDLEKWINSHQPISQSVALEWLKQLVEILEKIHNSGFFHRDIKPANIMLKPNGQLALIDFGTARQITDTYLTKVGANRGAGKNAGDNEITIIISHFYTPLEQIYGKAVPQSDFYALGRTFVRMMTGVRLMDLPTNRHTEKLIWRDKALQIDKPLADIIDSLMAPTPGKRPADTKIILQRIEKINEQNKFYRLTKSKAFRISIWLGLLILGTTAYFQIFLPLRAKSLVVQGEQAESANNSQGAQKLFDSAIKISPQVRNYIANFYFDKAARSTKNLEDAKKYYSISIKYNNQDVDTYTNLAFVCQLLKDYDCATSNYSKALQINPTWEGYFGLGTLYDDMGEKDLAEQQYNVALKFNKQAAQVLNNLSRLKNLKGDYDAAIALAGEGLKNTQMPKLQAALYKNLGWAKLKHKKLQEAQQYLKKAEQLDIQRADVHCLKAQIYDILEDSDNSFLAWEACLTLDSDLPEVFNWRDSLLQRIIKKNR